MKLPFSLPGFKEKKKSEYFLALLLRDEKVSAVILEELEGKIRVVGSGEEFFKTSIEQIAEEEWLTILDKAIGQAEQALPETIETHKTVFGVKEEWVEESRIKKEYLARLKKASDKLDLSPLGFIVINEAIVHLIGQEEGAPVTAILADIGKAHIGIALIRGGKVIEVKHAPIQASIPDTVDFLLKELSSPEVLPSRLLLLDSDLGDELSQLFIAHQWSKSLPFLHVPQISVLPKGFDAKAIVFGAAKQMGFDLLPADSEKTDKENTVKKSVTEETGTTFGFVIDKDIVQIPPAQSGSDVSAAPSLAQAIKRVKIPKLPPIPSDNRVILLPPILLLLLIGIVSFYVLAVRATITIAVTPTKVEQERKVTFSTSSPNDFAKSTITARQIEVSLEENVTTEATGKKDVGDKAKGTVTLYNNSESKKTLPQGTILASTNELEFLLDKDVVIASSSGDIFTGIKAGTAQALVIAREIGTEYNLPSQTKFTIDNSTILAAKNDEAFSGGSKKTVTVVDKKDIDGLIGKLPKELEKKAQEELRNKIEDDEVLIPLSITARIEKKQFDKDVGKETKQVTLTGTVKFVAMAYRNSDVEEFSKSLLKAQLHDKLILSAKGIQSQLASMKKTDEGVVESVLGAKASLLPKFSQTELISSITGKSTDEATRMIRKLPQIERVNISFSPDIPFLPDFLPRVKKNITLVIQTNG